MADEPENGREEREDDHQPGEDLYHVFRPAFDASRMFPDYSELLAALKPMSEMLASAVPDYRHIMVNAMPDYSEMLRAAAIPPDLTELMGRNVSELLARIDVRTLFPDYSKTFPRIDTRQVLNAYETALPRAVEAAEGYVLEEVVFEVELGTASEGQATPRTPAADEAARWISELPSAKKREFATKLANTIGTILAVALAALNGNLPVLAGALFAYATALYSIYAFVVTEDERRIEDGDDD